MSLRRRVAVAAVVVSLAAVCSSCATGARGVDVPPGSETLKPCAVATIDVDDLASNGVPGCDLQGSSLRFSDGIEVDISDVGSVSSTAAGAPGEQTEYVIVNWGLPGVGAAMIDADDRLVGVWASGPEALVLQHEQLSLSGDRPPD